MEGLQLGHGFSCVAEGAEELWRFMSLVNDLYYLE